MNRPIWRTVLIIAPEDLGARIGSALPDDYFAEVSTRIDPTRFARRVAKPGFAAVIAADCDGARAIAKLRALRRFSFAAPRIVVFETAPVADVLAEAFALGAHPIQWPIDGKLFGRFLATAQRNSDAYVEARVASRFEEQLGSAPLTNRQREICWNGTLGLSVKEVADLDGIGVTTVRTQHREILKRLQVASLDAFRWRVLRGVLPAPRRRK